jgi:hypothetical protein
VDVVVCVASVVGCVVAVVVVSGAVVVVSGAVVVVSVCVAVVVAGWARPPSWRCMTPAFSLPFPLRPTVRVPWPSWRSPPVDPPGPCEPSDELPRALGDVGGATGAAVDAMAEPDDVTGAGGGGGSVGAGVGGGGVGAASVATTGTCPGPACGADAAAVFPAAATRALEVRWERSAARTFITTGTATAVSVTTSCGTAPAAERVGLGDSACCTTE